MQSLYGSLRNVCALLRAVRSAIHTPLLPIALLAVSLTAQAQTVNVLTQHYDAQRTGANTNEHTLTPSNVNASQFGQIFSHSVDGYVYAQPLVVTGVMVNGQAHNVVYVATEHNSVYAFDADDANGANANPLWQVNFGPSVPNGDVGTGDVVPEIGITGTPVIDPGAGVLYVVAKTKENGAYFQRLHAIKLTDGTDYKPPVVIQATVTGTGDGSSNGQLPFDPLWEFQRPGLLLLNGVVYIGFSAHGDNGPYHGWIFGYNATTLNRVSVFCTSPNAVRDPSGYPLAGGGVWMSGGGLAADAGNNIYFLTGNGTFDVNVGNVDYGDSFVKLSTNGSLIATDYFTPYNQDGLNRSDADLGSGGLVVLPDSVASTAHPHLLVGAGKEGKIYLLNRDDMGHYHDNDDSQLTSRGGQTVGGQIGGTWSKPAYFNGRIYYQGNGDVLKAFSIANGVLSGTPVAQSNLAFNYPGATPSISANGAGSGIAWVLESGGNATLHAYDITSNPNTITELYNSNQAGGRDVPGGYVKFTVPTVANGKVYVPAQYNIAVYGLAQFVDAPVITPPGGEFTTAQSVTITDTTPGAVIHYTTDGSEPTQASPTYTGTFTVSTLTLVKAKAFKSGLHDSATTSAAFLIGVGPGSGNGLLANYFNDLNLDPTDPNQFQRVDPTIDFNWNGASPAPGIGGSNWSARWTGKFQARYTTTYTFYTNSDDGIRLWVNNQLLVDDWTYHAPTIDSGQIALVAGQSYDIKVEYFQGGGGAVAQLFYSVLNQALQIVPQSQLYSNQTGTVETPVITPYGGTFNPTAQVTITDATVGATIRYTLDGTEPTQTSTLYTAPFTLTDSAIVKAKAFKTGFNDSLSDTEVFTLNLNAPLYQINSGGGAFPPYSADKFFTAGAGHSRVGDVDKSLVLNPAPQGVYEAERFGNFSYIIPGLTPGVSYTLRLHFEDSDNTSIGQRVFNVAINGANALTNFDIIAAAGGNFKAIVKEFIATADGSGNITVTYSNNTPTYDHGAKSSAIEVISNVKPVTATPTFTPNGGSFVSTVVVTIADATPGAVIRYTTDGTDPTGASPIYTGPLTLITTTTLKAIAIAPGYSPSSIAKATFTQVNRSGYQINSGGGAVAPFAADNYFTGGSATSTAQAIDTTGVFLPAPQGVYQSARIGNSTYTFTNLLPGNVYNVRLHFADFTSTGIGQRKFNVTINGVKLLSNLDVFAATGARYKALVKPFKVTADNNGKITIKFAGVVGSAFVNGIEALPSAVVYYPNGFANATGLTFNGNATLATDRLRLTDGGGTEAGSVFTSQAINLVRFRTQFTFQLTNPGADGMTFCIQNVAPTALGPTGGGLGYGPDNTGGGGGIPNSVAVKFDLYSNQGEGVNSTGLYTGGAAPTIPSIDLTGTGIDLHSGDVFQVTMNYIPGTLTVVILDTTTQASATQTYSINIPAAIGSTTGFVGFTGGTGGLTATQDVLTWVLYNNADLMAASGPGIPF